MLQNAPANLKHPGLPALVAQADQHARAEHEPHGVRGGGEGDERGQVHDLGLWVVLVAG